MAGTIVSLLGPHAVYRSPKLVTGRIANELSLGVIDIPPTQENTRWVYHTNTRHVWYMPLRFSHENLYLANSPLLALEGWEMLLRGVPMIVCEEYWPRGGFKNLLVGAAFKLLGEVPFISQTKRGAGFLRSLGLNTFLVPPAEKKRKGSRKREHILFVGRAEESKNPRLFLRLAERMRDEQFVFIGRGSLEGAIKEKAKALPNLEHIPFLESREEVFDYYSKAKLLVLSSFKDPIGFVVAEALSAQTPVLASSSVGASDFLPRDWILRGFSESDWLERASGIVANQAESIALAEKTFQNEHLDAEDPYFEKTADELCSLVRAKWPHLGEQRPRLGKN